MGVEIGLTGLDIGLDIGLEYRSRCAGAIMCESSVPGRCAMCGVCVSCKRARCGGGTLVVVVFVTMCRPAKRGVASCGRKTIGVAARGAAMWGVVRLGLGPGCQPQVPCNMKEEEHERPAGTLRETEAAAAGTFTAANTGRTLTYSVQG